MLLLSKCESERKEGERERNSFDFACVGGRERNIIMRSGLQHRHLFGGMDVTILTTSLRPTFTVTLV